MVREDRPMTFFEHLDELRSRLMKVFVAFMVAFVVALFVHLEWTTVVGVPVPVPSFDYTNPMSSQLLASMLAYLTPPGVAIVTLEPQEYFLQVLKVGTFLALLFAMPFIVYEIGAFVAPALREPERRLIVRIAVPAAVLFAAGVVFGFFLVLPITFSFLYGLVPGNIARTLRVESFLDFILPFLVGFGLAFELPIIMVGLTRLGVVDPSFWKAHWRVAALVIFVFGAVITADGTGVTMVLVAAPMLVLYAAGYAISRAVGPTARAKSS